MKKKPPSDTPSAANEDHVGEILNAYLVPESTGPGLDAFREASRTSTCGVAGCRSTDPARCDRATMLGRLVSGDIVYARYPNGAYRFCLITSVSESSLAGRGVTGDDDLAFDRRTGIEQTDDDLVPGTIESIAPLPSDLHDDLLAAERRVRLGFYAGAEQPEIRQAENQAIRLSVRHFRANLLGCCEAGGESRRRRKK